MQATTPVRALACLISAMAVAGATAASALAVRYAAPSGLETNDCLTVASACDLKSAVEGASAKEQVIVEPGTYAVTSSIAPLARQVSVQGAERQPRPLITAAGVSSIFFATELNLSYLAIEETSGGSQVLGIDGGTLDRLLIRGLASESVLCQCYSDVGVEPMILRDSVIIAKPGSTVGAVGVNSNGGTSSATLYNDTIYTSDAQAPAIEMIHSLPGKVTLKAYNVIVYNAAGGVDVSASTANAAYVTMVRSDYSKPSATGVTAGEGDVSAAPQFVDAAGADFHELAGSPTVDAGVQQPEMGSLDFEGAVRNVGPSVDIGAFEFQPAPVVLTAAAGELTLTGTLLHGSVDPGGALITGCSFEYGPTTAYGASTPCAPGLPSGEGASAVSAALSGLTPDTTYHFRLAASGAGGAGQGQDLTFTTFTPIPPSTPSSTPPGSTPPTPSAPTLSLASTVLSLKPGGAVGLLRATCRAPAGTRCTVTGNVLASSTVLGTKGRAKMVKIGSARASIAAGATASVNVKLTAAAVRALRRRHSFGARLTATVGDGEASSALGSSLRVELIASRR